MYYANKLKTRVFKPTNRSIDEIPLEDMGLLFKSLLVSSKADYAAKRVLVREQLELAYIRKYNETHEDSYEGDFEFLDADIEMKMGKFRSLGSDQFQEWLEAIKNMSTQFNFHMKADEWAFPQMQAYLVEKVPIIYSHDNEISAKAMYEKVFKSDPRALAIIEIFKFSNRGILLEAMTSEKARDYNKLVPIVMAAYKKYNSVPYSKWNREEIWYVTEPVLAEAMCTEIPDDLTTEDKIAARDDALTVKTGDNIGKKRSAVTTYSLYPSGTSFAYGINPLLRHMILQTWCAHRDNRGKYIVLDTGDWDNQNITSIADTEVLRRKRERIEEVDLRTEAPF